jgi:hypothetical protein
MRHLKSTLAIAALAGALALSACDQTKPAAGMNDAEKAMSDKVASLEAELAAAKTGGTGPDAAPHTDAGPAAYIVNLKDGDTVTSPFRVVFGVYGMGVAPALTQKDGTGHHHLLVDTELTPEELKFAIPSDAQHIHFGGGQTETTLELPPGQHTLQLNFGDLHHEQFSPPILSPKITITVK